MWSRLAPQGSSDEKARYFCLNEPPSVQPGQGQRRSEMSSSSRFPRHADLEHTTRRRSLDFRAVHRRKRRKTDAGVSPTKQLASSARHTNQSHEKPQAAASSQRNGARQRRDGFNLLVPTSDADNISTSPSYSRAHTDTAQESIGTRRACYYCRAPRGCWRKQGGKPAPRNARAVHTFPHGERGLRGGRLEHGPEPGAARAGHGGHVYAAVARPLDPAVGLLRPVLVPSIYRRDEEQ